MLVFDGSLCFVLLLNLLVSCFSFFFFFKQKTAYEMRISDWSSDVCSSDLLTTYLFAWLVLIGASYGVKIGAHLGVDAFVKMFPERYHRYFILLAAVICCVYAGIMLYGAWDYWSKILRFGKIGRAHV